MSSDTQCLLCLERPIDPIDQIDIDCSNSKESNIDSIIEQYFSAELQSSLSDKAVRIICSSCWREVNTFHQFCLRVQRAHSALTQQQGEQLEIKEETLSVKAEHSDSGDEMPLSEWHQKRIQGLKKENTPVRSKIKKDKLNLEALEEELIDTDCLPNLAVISSAPEVKVPRMRKSRKTEALQPGLMASDCLSELGTPEVKVTRMRKSRKTELLQEKPIDTDWLPDVAITSSDPELKAEHIRKSHNSREPKGTNRYSVNHAKVQEEEEFIKQNFTLSCCLCECHLDDFAQLRKHFREQHQTSGYVQCCGKKLRDRTLLVDHLHLHQDPAYFSCADCGKVLADRHCLEVHQQYHKEKIERAHKCEICGKGFPRRGQLLRHADVHMEEKNHICSECGKAFPSKISMVAHYNAVHLKKYTFICDVCGKHLSSRSGLERHKEEHEPVGRPPIKCDLCGITVTSALGLRRHIRWIHTNRTPQTCPTCEHVSPSADALRRHIRYMHTLKPTHACSMCEKVFKRSEQLREHMSTHTGEILYTCSFCPRTFISKSNMHAHIKKMHYDLWQERRAKKAESLITKKQNANDNVKKGNELTFLDQN